MIGNNKELKPRVLFIIVFLFLVLLGFINNNIIEPYFNFFKQFPWPLGSILFYAITIPIVLFIIKLISKK